MSIVTVETTREDWEEAECHSSSHCVLARAIQRATSDPNWRVEGDSVLHTQKDVYHNTPEWAEEEAEGFDSGANTAMNITKGFLTGALPDFGFDLIAFEFDTATGDMRNRRRIGTVDAFSVTMKRIENGVYQLDDDGRFLHEVIQKLLFLKTDDEEEFLRRCDLLLQKENV